ncbi:alkaline phosphatase family protein [Leifsonia shinshuensis]|uniref:alkaline phosphatase family protein n=1 Tax=Leifsonia shinshuensis TaxID=150026 RepID=UPI001F504D9B|nr:alkaline phosphatase family protein [Leifsonia shinshuensis]MCI0158916.1 alkaline phosphatase family protein [Leifsonia shinshuensis]
MGGRMRGVRAAAGAVALALAVAGCTASASAPGTGTSARSAQSAPAAPPPPATVASPGLQHIVVIVDENKPSTAIIGDPDAPYLNQLARSGALATRYSAITHPSLPNYLALTSGTTGGITTDCNPPGGSCLVTGPNLAAELDRAGRSWKLYAESMPAPCTTTNTTSYAVKHNPFLYFPSVTAESSYCASHDVPYTRFGTDLASAAGLPDFAFISPNLCNDMHDCSVATGDAWLRANVPPILASPAFTTQRSLLVVTFDEGDASDNTVACVFAGPAAREHTVSSAPYTHYSLLRTIEDAWGLNPLTGEDAAATAMTPLLK